MLLKGQRLRGIVRKFDFISNFKYKVKIQLVNFYQFVLYRYLNLSQNVIIDKERQKKT